MVREIKIPIEIIKKWQDNPIGRQLNIPVVVAWEELMLTEEQMLANSIARANGEQDPYTDNSIFCISITREEV